MSKSSVMAEGLEGYIDVVQERISEIKDSINGLQRESYYKEDLLIYLLNLRSFESSSLSPVICLPKLS